MTIIIPAYKPDEKLLGLLDELKKTTSARILVVNDGSGEAYNDIFCKVKERCDVLLNHEVNRDCVTSGKCFHLSEAPFPYLQNGNNDAIL